MLMAVMLIVIGYADTKAVRPVAIAEEANGRVSLLYELAPQSSGQQTQRVEDGAFDDWWQQAEINSSTGGLEISGDNPNGNGLVRRWGQ